MALRLSEDGQGGSRPTASGDNPAQLKERLNRIESFVKQAAALAAGEARKAEETRQCLEAKAASLEALAEEKQAILEEKESAMRELEERLNSRIRDLESRLREKEQNLVQRETELNGLKTKDEETKNSADGKIPQLEEIMANWELAMAALAAQLRSTESELTDRGAALKEMEENVAELERAISHQIDELGKKVDVLSQKE